MMNRILVVVLCAALSSACFAVEIIAHRGASADAPENTLTAMKLAWEQGADAIELDLWLSKDGRLVVFHDPDMKRIAGIPTKVSESTWEELRRLDVGAWKDPRFAGERIPELESILDTIPKGRRAVLEIKCGPEIVPELKRVIDKRSPGELAIISFNFNALKASKGVFPKVHHYFLHSYKRAPATGEFPELEPLLARAKAAGFDGLNLQYEWPITSDFVARVKAAWLKLLVWTVNDSEIAKRLLSAGVDGITTDRPGWLREQLK